MYYLLLIIIISLLVIKITKDKAEIKKTENYLSDMEKFKYDILSGVSSEQRMKNMMNGKYMKTKKCIEPHKDKNGKIVVENSLLFKHDLQQYGAVQTYKWVEQGKYNLTSEELIKEKERLKNKYYKLSKSV